MKLSKKTSIWSYVSEIRVVPQLIIGIATFFCFIAIYLTGYLTRYTYLTFLDEKFTDILVFDEVRYFINGLLIWLTIALIIILTWSVYKIVICEIPRIPASVRIYQRACYLPITESEFNDSNIHNAPELTTFLTTNLFKDCQCSSYLYSMSFVDNIIRSYSVVIHISNEFKSLSRRNQIEAAIARKMAFYFDLWLNSK